MRRMDTVNLTMPRQPKIVSLVSFYCEKLCRVFWMTYGVRLVYITSSTQKTITTFFFKTCGSKTKHDCEAP